MNILVICKRYYTNRDLIGDRFGRLYYLPRVLAKRDHQVTVAAADYRSFSNSKCILDGANFYSLSLTYLTFLMYLFNLIRLAFRLKPDLIIGSGDIHFGVVGLFLSRLLGKQFYFDVYDHYETFASARIPGFVKLYHFLLRKADIVICASQQMLNFAKSFNPSVLLFMNGVNEDIFKPMDKIKVRQKHNISSDKVVIGYFGSMERFRGVDILIESCRQLHREYPSLLLLLAGKKGCELNTSYDWVRYMGVLPQSTIAELICCCDIVVIPYNRNLTTSMSNSCKVAEYLSCKVPIVSTDVEDVTVNYPEIKRCCPESICECSSVESMISSLRYQINARCVVETERNLSWDEHAKALWEVMEENQVSKAM